MGRSANYTKQHCAVAATLDIIGKPWTLLIIRDAFRGVTRFDQWQESLGLARNVLAVRLRHLVNQGILQPRLYCVRPNRYEYLLTPMGEELRPIIDHMRVWGERHLSGHAASPPAVAGDVFVRHIPDSVIANATMLAKTSEDEDA